MGKVDTDTIAKAAGAGGILAIIASWFTGKNKARYEALKLEVSTLHDIIEEWKGMAIAAIEENSKLRAELATVRLRVYELEGIVNKLQNGQ